LKSKSIGRTFFDFKSLAKDSGGLEHSLCLIGSPQRGFVLVQDQRASDIMLKALQWTVIALIALVIVGNVSIFRRLFEQSRVLRNENEDDKNSTEENDLARGNERPSEAKVSFAPPDNQLKEHEKIDGSHLDGSEMKTSPIKLDRSTDTSAPEKLP